MNLDDEEDRRELSLRVENYFMVEFVAIPPDFDICKHLTLREHVGLFDNNKIQLNKIKIIAESIKHSPVLCLLNNALLDQTAGIYLLSILSELGLVVTTIENPLRKSMENYKSFLKRYSENKNQGYLTHIRGQDVTRVNIVIINIFPMMSQKVIDEAMDIATKLQKYQHAVNKKIDKISRLD